MMLLSYSYFQTLFFLVEKQKLDTEGRWGRAKRNLQHHFLKKLFLASDFPLKPRSNSLE